MNGHEPDRHETALWNYLQLAVASEHKGQFPGRDKLLLLAGWEACQAGLLEIADRCRSLVLARNPHHLLGRYDHFHEMMQTDDGTALIRQLERQIPFERVELLVSQIESETKKIPSPPEGEAKGSVVSIERLLDELTDG